MRLYPKGELVENETAEVQKANKTITPYAATVNGSLTGINFGPDTIQLGEAAVGTFQETTIFTDVTPRYLTNGDITNGAYIIPEYIQDIEWEDGIVTGAINVTYRKYDSTIPTTSSVYTTTPNFVRWFLYVDGNVVAETDRIYTRDYTLCLPFAFPITAGNHQVALGVQAVEFTATDAVIAGVPQPTYQMYLLGTHQHFRNVRR